MFEVIGIAFVFWLVYVVVRTFLRAKSTVRAREFGVEARHISVRELGVPEAYHANITATKIELVKSTALMMRDGEGSAFKNSSWPRLLALVIYGEFHQDCEQWQAGNPVKEQLFTDLGITHVALSAELERDPRAVLFAAA